MQGIESYSTADDARMRNRLRSAALRQSSVGCRIGLRRKTHVHHQECTHAHRRTAKTGVAGVTTWNHKLNIPYWGIEGCVEIHRFDVPDSVRNSPINRRI